MTLLKNLVINNKNKTMKNILITLVILTALSCKAQTPIVSFTDYYINDTSYTENMYIKDTEGLLNPYIGMWKWESGNNSFTIIIEKIEMVHQNDSKIKRYRDKLYAKIEYIENGQVIFNTLSNSDSTLRMRSGIPKNNSCNFTFKDPIKIDQYGHAKISLINNDTQMKFYLRNNEGLRVLPAGQTTYDAEFSMPRRTEFILTKQ